MYYVLMLKAHHCDLHTMNANSVFGSRMFGICSSIYTLFCRTSRWNYPSHILLNIGYVWAALLRLLWLFLHPYALLCLCGWELCLYSWQYLSHESRLVVGVWIPKGGTNTFNYSYVYVFIYLNAVLLFPSSLMWFSVFLIWMVTILVTLNSRFQNSICVTLE